MSLLLTASRGWMFTSRASIGWHLRRSILAGTHGWQTSERVTSEGQAGSEGRPRGPCSRFCVTCDQRPVCVCVCGLTNPQLSLPTSRIFLDNSELQQSLLGKCTLYANEPNSLRHFISFETGVPSGEGLGDPEFPVKKTEVQ